MFAVFVCVVVNICTAFCVPLQKVTPRTKVSVLAAAIAQYWKAIQSAASEAEIANYRVEWENGILRRLTADPPARMFRVDADDLDENADLISPEWQEAVQREIMNVRDVTP